MGAQAVTTVTEQQQEEREFHWTDTAEPHSARRKAMLQKYGPQIRTLYGNDPWTAYQVGHWQSNSNPHHRKALLRRRRAFSS